MKSVLFSYIKNIKKKLLKENKERKDQYSLVSQKM